MKARSQAQVLTAKDKLLLSVPQRSAIAKDAATVHTGDCVEVQPDITPGTLDWGDGTTKFCACTKTGGCSCNAITTCSAGAKTGTAGTVQTGCSACAKASPCFDCCWQKGTGWRPS